MISAMIKTAIRRLNSRTIELLTLAGWAVLAVPMSLGQVGTPPASVPSSTADAPYIATMTFDVASVRASNPDSAAGIIVGGEFSPHSTTLRVTNLDIENLLALAYGVNRDHVVGLPRWPYPTMFNVEGKEDSAGNAKFAALTKEQQLLEKEHMVQALLTDRFKLRAHLETRAGWGYNLVVAKGGPKLGAAGSMPPSAEELKAFGDHPVRTLYQRSDGRGYDYVAHEASMQEIAVMLSGQMGRPVADETGLTEKYDFVLKYYGRREDDRNADDLDPTPPLDRAVQDQLGLKLEPVKGAVQVLVIDHVEKPSEN